MDKCIEYVLFAGSRYIQLKQALSKEESSEFHVKTTSDPEEIKALLEVGFEYVCSKDGVMFFRKRK